MNDASGTDGSGLDQDHMGNLVESILRSLGGILDECFGTTEGQAEEPYSNGQFDGVICHCEMYLEDFGDGIQDGDEKLSSWRPELATVQQVITAPTKRLSGGPKPQPVAQPAAQTSEPASVEPVAKEYYVRRGDKVMGPVSEDKIRSGIAGGRVKSTDQLSEQTSGPWQALDSSEFSTCF